MADEQTERRGRRWRSHGERDAQRHGQPHRRELRGRDLGRHRQGDGLSPDQGLRGRLRPDDLRPGVHEHGVGAQLGLLHRRRGRDPRVPRLPDRPALREVDLPRGRLPPDLRRAAHPGPARRVGLRDHPPHLRPREHQEVRGGLPLRRPPDGDAARHRRRALDLLPRREEDRRRARAPHGGGPADREDADARRLRLPAQPRAAVRLSGQRPVLPRQLPLDDVQDDRGQVRARPAARARPRRPLDPARRPRAELLDERGARGRLVAGRPVLGRGRRRGRALRPAARRRQRGGAEDARRDRDQGEHPRLPRAA